MSKRKSQSGHSDTRQIRDSRDLRASSGPSASDQVTDPQTSTWTNTADTLLLVYTHVVSRAIKDVVEGQNCSLSEIEYVVAQHCLQWPLPVSLFRLAVRNVHDYCEQIRVEECSIDDFFQQSGSQGHPEVAYLVFHHGRSHVYYNQLPVEVLNLKENILFWIDHFNKEVWSRGKFKQKTQRPVTKWEQILRCFCKVENAGRITTVSDLEVNMWTARGHAVKDAYNNIGGHRDTVNDIAGEDFILSKSLGPLVDRKKILRLRGKGFKIGEKAHEELCIVSTLYKRSGGQKGVEHAK